MVCFGISNGRGRLTIGTGVGQRVGRQAGGVGVGADAGAVVHPLTHGVVLRPRVAGLEADGGRHEVAPAFAHAAGFEGGEAVGVGGTAGETVGHWRELVICFGRGRSRSISKRSDASCVKRYLRPWVYSWMTTPASKAQSRSGFGAVQMYMRIYTD